MNTIKLILLFITLLLITTSVQAQVINISKKFICDASDSENPKIFIVRKGQQAEATFEEASKLANKLVRKAKKNLKKLKENNASEKKINKAKKKKKNAVAVKKDIKACEGGTLDPPNMGMSVVNVTGKPDSSVTGTCTMTYQPVAGQVARAIADQTTVQFSCVLSSVTGNSFFGDVITKVSKKTEKQPFIAGINLAGNGFNLFYCQEGVLENCDLSKNFASVLADSGDSLILEFTHGANTFRGKFPGL